MTDKKFWDSVLLEDLTEDNLISNLNQRFRRDQVYTYIGTYLIFLNSHKPLALYGTDAIHLYSRRSLFKLPPHIYGLTNAAYEWMQGLNEEQCVIVTGESGSGKTETAKHAVDFLTRMRFLRHLQYNTSMTGICRSANASPAASAGSCHSLNSASSNCVRVPNHVSPGVRRFVRACSAEHDIVKVGDPTTAASLNPATTYGSLKKCPQHQSKKTVDFDIAPIKYAKSTENLINHQHHHHQQQPQQHQHSYNQRQSQQRPILASACQLVPAQCQVHSSSLSSYHPYLPFSLPPPPPSNASSSSSNNTTTYHHHLYRPQPSAIASTVALKKCPKHNPDKTSTSTVTSSSSAAGASAAIVMKCDSCLKRRSAGDIRTTIQTSVNPSCRVHCNNNNNNTSCSSSNVNSNSKNQQSIRRDSILKMAPTPNSTSCDKQSNLLSAISPPPPPFLPTAVASSTGGGTALLRRKTSKLSSPAASMKGKSLKPGKSIELSQLDQMQDRVANAECFLTAMGTAVTLKNWNSSRFGKFFDVAFDFKGDIIGGTVSHYMLEKSRVTNVRRGERNFHIFYQLLSGADIPFLKQLKLHRNVDKYDLLRNTFAGDEDKAMFTSTKGSLERLGLTSDEILSVFKVIAVILKLGNLKFIPITNIDGTEGCSVSNEFELVEVAQLLELDVETLTGTLTRSEVDASGNPNNWTELDAVNATTNRSLLCRTLYGRLFTWTCNRVNEALKPKQYSQKKNFGILDFYGFESLDVNSFEQLAINYANERIHQNFLQHILKQQQELYAREGLDWVRIDFFDNDSICELIDKSSYGILKLLDEPQVQIDGAFSARLQQCCSGNPNFNPVLMADDHDGPLMTHFQVRHFPGPVNYQVQGFLEKNMDLLPRSISSGLYRSRALIIRTLFPEGNPTRASRRPTSNGTTLRISMQTLLQSISTRRQNYVFCLRANDECVPGAFELPLVQHQVRYMSLMPLVRLWRTGYCFNMFHVRFFCRYKMLNPVTWPNYSAGSLIEGIATIIERLPLPMAEFVITRKRVFIRSPRTVFELEELRRSRLDELALLIQTAFRCYSNRKRFLVMRRSQIVIARAWRTWRECRLEVAPFKGHRHLFGLYRVAREEYRIMKYRRQVEWAVTVIQRQYIQWKRRQFLLTLPLRFSSDVMSPTCIEWPVAAASYLAETSVLLRNIHHRWKCYIYRRSFDQTARNRMREKVTASIIFRERKSSYARSVSHPFLGDYVRLRQNVQWKKISTENNDQYVVFADIINKITRSSGKYVPILLVLSTSAMLLLDQRTLQVKYRVPAAEIYRLSLSPFVDDVAVFHVKASEMSRKKGDFVFQTCHVIEIVTKLFLVIQNATTKPPEVHINPEFEANFNNQTVIFSFKCVGLPESQTRICRKGNRMEIVV